MMLKDKFVIINIPFNNKNYNENRLTKEWIKIRIDIFFNYTLKSLQCQTNQNFVALLNCDGESLGTINEILKEKKQLPDNVQFIDSKQNTSAIVQLANDYEYFYLVRIDSDNLYHKDFVQKLYDIQLKPDTEALLCQLGYLLDVRTMELVYNFHPSPSYYTFVYKTSEYKHKKRYVLSSHTNVINDFKVELLNDYYYITTITGENVLFTQKHMKGKEQVKKEKIECILQDFGLLD